MRRAVQRAKAWPKAAAAALVAFASSHLAAAEGAAEGVADPIAAARARIEATCLKVDYPRDFARRVDLNGDGRQDVVITYNVVCDGYHSMFCGRDGCVGDVYVSRVDGGYDQVNLPPTVEPTRWNGLAAVRVPSLSADCVRDCERVLVWDGLRFSPPGAALRAGLESEAGDASSLGGAGFGSEELEILALEAVARLDGLASDSASPVFDAGSEPPLSPVGAVGSAAVEAADQAADAGAEAVGAVGRGVGVLSPEAEAFLAEGPKRAQWFLARGLRPELLSAAVLGEDGRSALFVSCGFGAAAFEVAVAPTLEAALRTPKADGATTALGVLVDEVVLDSRLARLDAARGFWIMRTPLKAPLLSALRNGATVGFRESAMGLELGRFTLAGSARALDALTEMCGE